MNVEVIGNPDRFAFEVHEGNESWFLRDINFWIGGYRLFTAGCWLPAFLQMAQRFVVRQLDSDDNETIRKVACLTDAQLISQCNPTTLANAANIWFNSRFNSNRHCISFDEATFDYEIYAFDAPQEQTRIVWTGRVECGTCPREHCGTVRSVYLPRSEFIDTFENLFRHFEADLKFQDKDWGDWHNRHQAVRI